MKHRSPTYPRRVWILWRSLYRAGNWFDKLPLLWMVVVSAIPRWTYYYRRTPDGEIDLESGTPGCRRCGAFDPFLSDRGFCSSCAGRFA